MYRALPSLQFFSAAIALVVASLALAAPTWGQTEELAPPAPQASWGDCRDPSLADHPVCAEWLKAFEAWKQRQQAKRQTETKTPEVKLAPTDPAQQQLDALRKELEEAERLKSQMEAELKAARREAPPPTSSATAPTIADRPNVHRRNFALIIGNNKYANLPDLKTAIGDAAALSELLKLRYSFAPSNVKLLLNADRRTILRELAGLRRRLGQDDRLLIYYAGHGEIDPATEEGFWLPVDAEVGESYTWIANDDVRRELRGLSAKHVLVLADSCFSGSLTRSKTSYENIPKDRFFTEIDAHVSRKVISSGGTEPVADAGSGGHSVFAYYLLKALRENDQPYMASFELFNKLARAVTNNSNQKPEYGTVAGAGDEGSGDFTFILSETINVDSENTPPPKRALESALELAYWDAIKDSVDPTAFQEFLKQFPEGNFSSLARRKIKALQRPSPAPPALIETSPLKQKEQETALIVPPKPTAYRQPAVEPASLERMAFPMPDKPSIAVLPFVNMSGDPEQEYLADGISENIITALSKVSGLFVISGVSTFTYKGKAVKVQRVAEEMGVRYVLEGSMQKTGREIRVTARLIDAIAGNHLWADRYDREVDHIFALLDEITREIILSLRVELKEGEQVRIWQVRAQHWEAVELFWKSLERFRNFMAADNIEARRLAEQAAEVDPQYALVYVIISLTHLFDSARGWSDSPAKSMAQAAQFAEKALSLDDTIPEVYGVLGLVHLFKREYEVAISLIEKGIALNSNNAEIHAILGTALNFLGRPEEGKRWLIKAMRLSPYYPEWYLENLAASYGLMGQDELAIQTSKELLRRNPSIVNAYVQLVISYIRLNREEEARAMAAEVLNLEPDFSSTAWANSLPYKDRMILSRRVDLMRQAGLPE